jgi:hypothetical protein
MLQTYDIFAIASTVCRVVLTEVLGKEVAMICCSFYGQKFGAGPEALEKCGHVRAAISDK